ncbi:MAG: UDP-N-acetylmuramate dehydrogenase [Desulfuromonadales bacterium]|nr:UDP-N-acetylmuramate dehydrogenase [Desulfuromonadales bacterium]NIS41226.1 UDP-N-acetylmuramate dehydrogenase [Desulfuromonadales bacterium]
MSGNWVETAERAAGIFDKLRTDLRGQVRTGVPMADYTTWRIGGPAALLIEPADIADLRLCLELLQDADIPWLPLGSGSNLLVKDGGIPGAVIRMSAFREMRFAGDRQVVAGGGLPLMTLVRACAGEGLSGIEHLAGIPGTIGGAVFMNAGAGEQNMAGVVRSVHLLTGYGEKIREAGELGFAYRQSSLREGEIVIATTLRFDEADPEDLGRVVQEKLRHRRQAQGVGAPSAGSVFKNPPGVAAWKLIDNAGLRGRGIGGARVSEKHANFIVNSGGATAADMLELMDLVRNEVARCSGIVLEPEVRVLGIDGDSRQGGRKMEKR